MAYKIFCICAQCGTDAKYDVECDAMYCPECKQWLESKCGDVLCEFCNHRPTNRKVTVH